MQLDFGAVLTNLTGQPLRQTLPEGGEAAPLTLREVAIEALCRDTGDRSATGTDKFKRWQLAHTIHKGDPVEVTAEQVSLLKERIGETMPTVVVGPAFMLLEREQPPAES